MGQQYIWFGVWVRVQQKNSPGTLIGVGDFLFRSPVVLFTIGDYVWDSIRCMHWAMNRQAPITTVVYRNIFCRLTICIISAVFMVTVNLGSFNCLRSPAMTSWPSLRSHRDLQVVGWQEMSCSYSIRRWTAANICASNWYAKVIQFLLAWKPPSIRIGCS